MIAFDLVDLGLGAFVLNVNVFMIDASDPIWTSVPWMLGSEFVLRMHGVASGATLLAAGVIDLLAIFAVEIFCLGQEVKNDCLGAVELAVQATGTS